jgi:hypothetical protein
MLVVLFRLRSDIDQRIHNTTELLCMANNISSTVICFSSVPENVSQAFETLSSFKLNVFKNTITNPQKYNISSTKRPISYCCFEYYLLLNVRFKAKYGVLGPLVQ